MVRIVSVNELLTFMDKGFISVFSSKAIIFLAGYNRQVNLFELNLFIKKLCLKMVKTNQAKVSSEPINLPGALP